MEPKFCYIYMAITVRDNKPIKGYLCLTKYTAINPSNKDEFDYQERCKRINGKNWFIAIQEKDNPDNITEIYPGSIEKVIDQYPDFKNRDIELVRIFNSKEYNGLEEASKEANRFCAYFANKCKTTHVEEDGNNYIVVTFSPNVAYWKKAEYGSDLDTAYSRVGEINKEV